MAGRGYIATFPGTFDNRFLCYPRTMCLMNVVLPPLVGGSTGLRIRVRRRLPFTINSYTRRLTKEASFENMIELHLNNCHIISQTPLFFFASTINRNDACLKLARSSTSRFNQPKVEGQLYTRFVSIYFVLLVLIPHFECHKAVRC